MKLYKFNGIRDERSGALFVVDYNDIPFIPKRIFWVTNVNAKEVRGNHAHIECLQMYICTMGRIKVDTYDGKNRRSIVLLPGEGIFIDKLIWSSETYLTGDDILLVLCSASYDTNDYINEIDLYETRCNKKCNR